MKWISTLAVVLAVAVAPVGGQSGNDLFQKALSKERVDGQLTEAIALYERIAREFVTDRALAAKALLQMGRCYERLGRSDAKRAYERVVQDFADQKTTATEARARLAALARPAAAESTRVTVRQLWAGEGVDIEGSVSADGRYLSFTDWSTGDVAVRDFTAGKNVRLTKKGSWASPEYADFSAISRDGKQVAYAWTTRDGTYDFRLIGADGSEPRVLVRHPELTYFVPHAWSPDHKSILTLFYRRDRTKQIALVAAADGSARILKSLDWREPKEMSFSPDGRWIAYDFPPNEDSPERDIYLLATDGSREVHLIDHAANDHAPFWMPDGTRVVFVSDRGNGWGLWSVRVAAGRAEGAAELIKPEVGAITPLGVTHEGALYYGLMIGSNDVYLTAMDQTTARLTSKPSLVASRFLGFNATPAFSPDGEWLAFVSQRKADLSLTPGSRVLVIRSLATGTERVLEVPMSIGFELEWSPDGRALMSAGRDLRGRYALYQVDVHTGHFTQLVPGVSSCSVGCSPKGWFPDGKSIYYVRGLTSRDEGVRIRGLMRKHLESGVEEEITRYDAIDGYSFLTLAPDGRSFAGWFHDTKAKTMTLTLVPSGGGEPRALVRLKDEPPTELAGMAWSPDAKHVYYVQRTGTDKADLWRIAIAGGDPANLGPLTGRVHDLAVHPDGTRIAFSTRAYKPEVWVMENFVPVPPRASAGRR